MKLPMNKTTWKIVNEVSRYKEGYYLVGLSGGVDSIVLTQAAQFLATRKNSKLKIGVVIINHNLQDGIKTVINNTVKEIEKMGVSPIIIKDVDVKSGNMENNARIARYEAFEETLKETGANGIFLGHNLDDQTEQFFLGLSRGSGLRSISGIKEKRGHYIRPLLSISRDEILEAAEVWGLSYWEDPHNEDTKFSRVMIRKEIIPVIKSSLGMRVLNNLIKTMKMAEEDNDALDYIVEEKVSELLIVTDDNMLLSISELKKMPKGLRTRIIHNVLNKASREFYKSSTIEDIDKLIYRRGKNRVDAPSMQVSRTGDILVFNHRIDSKDG